MVFYQEIKETTLTTLTTKKQEFDIMDNGYSIDRELHFYLQHQEPFDLNKNGLCPLPLLRTYSTYGAPDYNPKQHHEQKIITNIIRRHTIPSTETFKSIRNKLGDDNIFYKTLLNICK